MVSFIVDLCAFSPNGIYLACVIHTEKKILVRNCDKTCQEGEDKLKLEHRFLLDADTTPINEIVWSPDSLFIGASCKKHAVLSVHSILDRKWKCKISFGKVEDEGMGLERFWWGRDGRHLIAVGEEFMCLSVWSIRRKAVHYIKDIAKIADCHSFSPTGSSLSIAHVDDKCKYYLGIYSGKTWEKKKCFYIASKDLAGISWSPAFSSEDNDNYIACWDSTLFANLYIYHAENGELLKHYAPYGMSCGFDTVQWSTSGHFLICTAHSRNEIHVLNGITFGVLIHDILEPRYTEDLFPSGEKRLEMKMLYEISENGMSKYQEITKWPTLETRLPSKHLLPTKKFSWNKGTYMKLHPSETFIACTTQLYPEIVWIYHLHSARVASVLFHENAVLDFDWNPFHPKLAIICASPDSHNCSSQIHFWTCDNDDTSRPTAFIRNVQNAPTNFTKRSSLKWSPQGNLLTIRDYDANIFYVLST